MRDELSAFRKDLETGEILASQTSHPRLPRGASGRPRTGRGKRGVAIATIAGLAVVAAAIFGGLRWLDRDGEAVAVQAANRKALAVFYFQNLTGDPALDWLRTGLTDMLVTDLSQSPDLQVLGTDRPYQILAESGGLEQQQVSFDTIQAVARRSDSGSALVGSFAKVGETIRLNVRLQDTTTGETIASEKLEGEGDDSVFTLVDDLTRRVARHLALAQLREGQQDRNLASVTTDCVEAYRFYVEGIGKHERGDEEAAIPALERSVELDPEFAMALAKLSVAHRNEGNADEAKEYAGRALEHLDRLSERERYYIEGIYYALDPETQDRAYAAKGQVDRGVTVLEEYLNDHPDNPDGLRYLVSLLFRTGDFDRAEQALDRLDELAPGTSAFERWSLSIYTSRWPS